MVVNFSKLQGIYCELATILAFLLTCVSNAVKGKSENIPDRLLKRV